MQREHTGARRSALLRVGATAATLLVLLPLVWLASAGARSRASVLVLAVLRTIASG